MFWPALKVFRSVLALTAVVALALAFMVGGADAASSPSCNLYASTTGSDSAAGSVAAPFRTVQKLLNALSPGQTGCLRAGTYTENIAFQASSVTLTSAPGEIATIAGRVYVPSGHTDETLSNTNIDGSAIQEATVVQVFADRFKLLNTDITAKDQDHICIVIAGGAKDVLIQGNRIHDCGVPALNFHVHGIYVQDADRTQIVGNAIYDNQSGWGIQFWENGDDTLVANNVIDGNSGGIIIAGCDDAVSERNTIQNNIITNNGNRYGVTSYWCSTIGSGNVVTANCMNANAPSATSDQVGFTVTGTISADPQYVDRSGKNYTLKTGSPCSGKGLLATVGPSTATTTGGSGSGTTNSGSGTTSSGSGTTSSGSGTKSSGSGTTGSGSTTTSGSSSTGSSSGSGGTTSSGSSGSTTGGGSNGGTTVPAAAPVNTAPPTISGSGTVGNTLSATAGTWSGSPSVVAYQWMRCARDGTHCTVISGATSKTYRVSWSDMSSSLTVTVTATNQRGSTQARSAFVVVSRGR